MATKRKSNVIPTEKQNDQTAVPVNKKARKLELTPDASGSQTKEKKPQTWQDVKLDGEDEVCNPHVTRWNTKNLKRHIGTPSCLVWYFFYQSTNDLFIFF